MADVEAEEAAPSSCCSPEAQQTCCEPEAKGSCCDTSHGEGCGCSAGQTGGAPAGSRLT